MEQSSYPDHVRHASAPFIVRMAEETSRANLTIAISSHGFELHGLGKIGHVHHQTGICEVPIAVEETGHASIKETTDASFMVQGKRARIAVISEAGLLSQRLPLPYAADDHKLCYIG